MARMIGSIPNFINGVSQQPFALRLPSQGNEQKNCYSSVPKGLGGRAALDHVVRLGDALSSNTFTHIIDRDENEKYQIVFDKNASIVSPNVLSLTQSNITASEWTKSTGATQATQVHDDDDPSYDYRSAYQRVTFDGTAGAAISIAGFATGAADDPVTFSMWLRLRNAVTLSDLDNVVYLSGARLVSTATSTINGLETGEWQKVEVAADVKAAPGTDTFTISLRCDEAVEIDVAPCQLEVSDAATMTILGGANKPRLDVYDFFGMRRQVWSPLGSPYLVSSGSPDRYLKALTVADRTYLLNRDITVEKTTARSAARDYEALIVVKNVEPGSLVKVRVAGVEVFSVAISDTDPTELGTDRLAFDIQAALVSAGYDTVPWSSTRIGVHGNVIHISNTDTDFDIAIRDDQAGAGIYAIRNVVQTFAEVPRTAPNGYKIEVRGDIDTGAGAYWISFDGAIDDSVNTWSETVAPDTETTFAGGTMPHELLSLDNGVFCFDRVPWATRQKGDLVTNPWPTFMGGTINDMFFHKGRLSFLSAENAVLSEAAVPGNFFRTTVTSLIDSDPIDVGSNHTKISILQHAVSFQEQLLLFSGLTQFRLTQGAVLSPNSVGIEPMTEYENSTLVAPTVVGNFVFFGVEKSNYASIMEYFTSNDSSQKDAREITGHVTEYIPTNILRMLGTSNEQVIVVQSADDAVNRLRVYKYFWAGNDKVQSSWSYWELPDVTKVLGYGFVKSTVYLVVNRADGSFIEKIELDTGNADASGTGYNLKMDRKIFSTDARVNAVYDSGTDRTTYTFIEHVWKTVPLIVGVAGNSIDNPVGRLMPIIGSPTSYDANTIVLDGDTTADDFCFGIPYECEFELSKLVMKSRSSDGSEVPITEGRLQLMWMNFRYAFTGYFEVSVQAEGRALKTYTFNGRSLGSSEDPVGTIPVDDDGSLRVPILSRNDRVIIKIRSSDPLPFRIISADFIGNQVSKFPRK